MNREIKFRAWDEPTKKFLAYGFSVIGETTIFNGLEVMIHETPVKGVGSLERLINLKISEFVGLKDKNGKDIYEGDVIKSALTNQNVVVEYDLNYAQFTYGGCEFNVESPINTIEVIGNIYENPDLAPITSN